VSDLPTSPGRGLDGEIAKTKPVQACMWVVRYAEDLGVKLSSDRFRAKLTCIEPSGPCGPPGSCPVTASPEPSVCATGWIEAILS
jgi:hypothetical protein